MGCLVAPGARGRGNRGPVGQGRSVRQRVGAIRSRTRSAIVLRNRGVRLATLGYLGHMWELYAMWTWIPAFAAASIAASGGTADASGLARRVRRDRERRRRLRDGRAWADALGQGASRGRGDGRQRGLRARRRPGVRRHRWPLLRRLAVVWGFSVVADSAQFSALVAEYSPRTHVGTALTLQTCAGFLLTMISMRLLPAVAASIGWRWAFLLLVPGPVLGALAMRRLAN